jgi:hypothetical protein
MHTFSTRWRPGLPESARPVPMAWFLPGVPVAAPVLASERVATTGMSQRVSPSGSHSWRQQRSRQRLDDALHRRASALFVIRSTRSFW